MGSSIHRITLAIVTTVLILGTTTVPAETETAPTESFEVRRQASIKMLCIGVNGKYANNNIPPAQLLVLLDKHQAWLRTYDTEEKRNSGTAMNDPRRANLCGADLSGADLSGANLSGADLFVVNLSKANLSRANLNGANLLVANLSGANLWGANLSDARFEPNELPPLDSIATAHNLDQMYYDQNPQALIKLRKAFKEAGYTEQERAITYAIKRSEQWRSKTVWDKVEGVFKYVFFDFPTQWGMYPGRALRVLVILMGVFALPYIFALRYPNSGRIYRKWGTNNTPTVATSTTSGERRKTAALPEGTEALQYRWKHAIFTGLQFSLLSAFHIGFRELNVGNWISRLQARDYTLYATGWVRSVAGTQSLISVYLLAMWALTYFGRPFD